MRSTEHDHRNRIDLMDLVERWGVQGLVEWAYIDDVFDDAGNWVKGGHWWVRLYGCTKHGRKHLAWNLAQGCWLDTRSYVLHAVTQRIKL